MNIRLVEYDSSVFICDDSGGTLDTFECRLDLTETTTWMEMLNIQLMGADHNFFYSLMFENHFLWGNIQYAVFDELKLVNRYQLLLTHLNKNWERYKLISIDVSPELAGVLSFLGMFPGQRKTWPRIIDLLRSGLLGAFNYFSLYFFKIVARRRPRPVLLYTPDIIDSEWRCDFRFFNVYNLLGKKSIRFYEVFHSSGLLRALKGRWLQKRVCWYLESVNADVDALPRIPKLSLNSLLERWWAYRGEHFVRRALGEKKRIKSYMKILRQTGVKILLAMDDMRSIPSLVCACNQAEIPVVLIQHGLLTPYHIGWVVPGISPEYLFKVDKYLVHTPYWEGVLFRHAPHLHFGAEQISGWSDNGGFRVFQREGKRRDSLRVLIVYETLWPDLKELQEFMSALNTDERLTVVFKVRRDVNEAKQIRQYFGTEYGVTVVNTLDEQVLSTIDVIVGSHSSLLYQLLVTEIPIVKIMTSYAYGDQLILDDLATPWHEGEDAMSVMEEALGTHPEKLRQRALQFMGDEVVPNYKEQLLKIIEQIT